MGRPLKDLTPTRSFAAGLGAEVRHWRLLRGLSQDGLGVAIHHSGALVSKVERGERLATLRFCEAVDAVLETDGALVRMWAADTDRSPRAGDPAMGWVDRLRRSLGRLDLADDAQPADLRGLARRVARATDLRLQARYGELAALIPDLIVELAGAEIRASGDVEKRRATGLTALGLRAADGLAFKFGYRDLSSHLIDLMRIRAERAENPALLAATAYVRTETYFATGDLDTAHTALIGAIDRVSASGPRLASAAGALHMRAAVVAARLGHGDVAADHLVVSGRFARDVPDGVYCGTAFGPASLRIHELAVAAELHDPAGIERAARWQPPQSLPAERRSHYYIELGRAELGLGRSADALGCLANAHAIAPQHVRSHPQVKRMAAALLRSSPAVPGLADVLTWLPVQ